MSNRPKWLPSKEDDFGGCKETIYDIDALKASTLEVRELIPGESWLVLNDNPYDEGVKYSGWLEFALLQFHSSNADGSSPLGVLVFHGDGPSCNLREPRHTYWGEDGGGYLFYPRTSVIESGLSALKEFYDFN